MRAVLLVLAIVTACDKSTCPCADLPPPVVRGKCLPEVFVGAAAIKQTCVFESYSWNCTTITFNGTATANCVRGTETKAEKP